MRLMGRTWWRRWRSTGRRSASRSGASRGVQQLPAEESRAQDEQDALGLRIAALRRAGPGLAALHLLQGALQPALRRALRRGCRHDLAGARRREAGPDDSGVGPEALRRIPRCDARDEIADVGGEQEGERLA